MLIGQVGDKMYIIECIVINKLFKIINNFNDINCMLMILNFNINLIVFYVGKIFFCFIKLLVFQLNLRVYRIFFQFVMCIKIRVGFVNFGKKINYFVLLKQLKYNLEEYVLGKIMYCFFYYRNQKNKGGKKRLDL